MSESNSLCLLTLAVEQFECKEILVRECRHRAHLHFFACCRVDMRPETSDALAVAGDVALIVHDLGVRAFELHDEL